MCIRFHTHQFKYLFWVQERIVSLRQFLLVPTLLVLVEKQEQKV